MTIKKISDMRLQLAVDSWQIAILLIATLVTLLYGKTLSFGYVWDDTLLFLDKVGLMNEPLSWALLAEPVLPGTTYFRPLVFLSWYIEFHAFGQSPTASHLVNVLLLMGNSILLFIITKRIGTLTNHRSSARLGLVAALLYAAHPALIESTAWISGRFDAMVTLFILLASHAYLSARTSNWQRITLISFFMLAAMLCKESGIVLPAVLLCIWIATNLAASEPTLRLLRRAFRSNSSLLTALAATIFFYMHLRVQAMGQIYHSVPSQDYFYSAFFDYYLPLEALKFYAAQALLPFHNIGPLHPLAELDPHSLTSLLCSTSALLIFLASLAWCWLGRSTSAWLFLSGFLCLVPVLHFVPLTIGGNIGHERFMTAPLAFIVMGVVFLPYHRLLARLSLSTAAQKRVLSLLGASWLSLATWTTSSIVPFWSGELSLWSWAYHAHPDFDYARYNYLYGALKDLRTDLVQDEIIKTQQKHGGLDVADQILYANLLIRSLDPEGMKYLEGVMIALPQFHKEVNGRQRADNFMLTSAQMGGAYADYANGLMIFEANATKALAYNEIAQWYFKDSERIPIQYQKASILYTLGHFSEAEDIFRRQESIYHYRKDSIKKAAIQLAQQYCSVKKFNTGPCREMLDRRLIEANKDS